MKIEGDFFEIKYNNESQGKKYQKDVIWLRSLIFHYYFRSNISDISDSVWTIISRALKRGREAEKHPLLTDTGMTRGIYTTERLIMNRYSPVHLSKEQQASIE